MSDDFGKAVDDVFMAISGEVTVADAVVLQAQCLSLAANQIEMAIRQGWVTTAEQAVTMLKVVSANLCAAAAPHQGENRNG